MSISNHSRGNTANYCIRRYITRHERPRCDDGAGPYSHTFHNHCASAEPDIMAHLGRRLLRGIRQFGAFELKRMTAYPVHRVGSSVLANYHIISHRTEASNRSDVQQFGPAAQIGAGTDLERTEPKLTLTQRHTLLQHQLGAARQAGRRNGGADAKLTQLSLRYPISNEAYHTGTFTKGRKGELRAVSKTDVARIHQ